MVGIFGELLLQALQRHAVCAGQVELQARGASAAWGGVRRWWWGARLAERERRVALVRLLRVHGGRHAARAGGACVRRVEGVVKRSGRTTYARQLIRWTEEDSCDASQLHDVPPRGAACFNTPAGLLDAAGLDAALRVRNNLVLRVCSVARCSAEPGFV